MAGVSFAVSEAEKDRRVCDGIHDGEKAHEYGQDVTNNAIHQ